MARTLMVSTLTRAQSTWPRSPSRSKTRRWSWSNTPTVAHSVSRRQQVAGEPQPSCCAGSSRHGVEVRAIYTIAAKQARSGMARCRPPYGGRGGVGSKGATSTHSSSGTRLSARVVMARDHARTTPRSETTSKAVGRDRGVVRAGGGIVWRRGQGGGSRSSWSTGWPITTGRSPRGSSTWVRGGLVRSDERTHL